MGLGSFIGKVAGGLLGGGSGTVIARGIGSILGSRFDERREHKKAAAWDDNRFVRLRSAAEKGGIHVLEALRAGGAAPVTAGQPRLITATAAANAHDGLDNFMKARAEEVARVKNEAEKTRNASNSSVLGSGLRGATEARINEATVTNTTGEPKFLPNGEPNPRFEYSKPTRADFSVITERHGEAELVEQIAFPANWADDKQYNWMLREIAQKTGRTREQLHNEVATRGSNVLREWVDLLMSQSNSEPGAGKSPTDPQFWGAPRLYPNSAFGGNSRPQLVR